MKPTVALCLTVMIASALASGRVLAHLGQLWCLKTERREGELMLVELPSKDSRLAEHRRYCILHMELRASPPFDDDLDPEPDGPIPHSAGLDLSFCEEHKEALNHRVRVRGVRVGGARIGQACGNRACFTFVTMD